MAHEVALQLRALVDLERVEPEAPAVRRVAPAIGLLPRGGTADEVAVCADRDRVGQLALGRKVAGNVLVKRRSPFQMLTFPFVRICELMQWPQPFG